MYVLAAITDNKNHKFLFKFLQENCKKIAIEEVPLTSIIGDPSSGNLFYRIKTAAKIKTWVDKNTANYNGVLVFSDYYFVYRTLIHFCRRNKKAIFIYQDGYIIYEPWPKNISGIFKRLVYQSFKLVGYGHLFSYLSFHTNPNQIFAWGNFFSRIFRNTSSSEVINVGTVMYAKNFQEELSQDVISNRILYYCTFFREPEKNTQTKAAAIKSLKSILSNHESLACDIKLHPLDTDKDFIRALLKGDSMDTRVHFLENNFFLHREIAKYRFIISEFSTETLFASIFCSNVYFIKNELTEKHFKLLSNYLKDERIGHEEFYKIDQNKIELFQAEYFQKFNIDRFEQAVQIHR